MMSTFNNTLYIAFHRRTIRVVWFGDEEIGGLGGKAYAKAHAGERHDLAAESDFGADRVWRFNTNLPDSVRHWLID